MKLLYVAKRRLDGLIDENWIAGFEACQNQNDRCPHLPETEEFASWMEGWAYAGQLDGRVYSSGSNGDMAGNS
jgi:hypothetical protein